MNLQDKIDEANKSEHSSAGGGWAKLKEGKNQFRLLTEPVVMFEDFKKGVCYTGCGFTGSAKYLVYILDRADKQVKLWKMPYSLFKQLVAFQEDEDFAFENFPMNYDIKIDAKGAGTKEVEYTMMPSPTKSEVPTDFITGIIAKSSPEEIIEKMKEKNIEKHKADGTYQAMTAKPHNVDDSSLDGIDYPEEEINLQDIPF